ncbi:MAG TPA: Ni/Fe hydrogenase subunit delta [Persephonella sp.]|uniref:Putative [NiFe] hydrogenase, delta subunit n=1 Tax=Persephonella marina (strain DSM 14350 / EX-H1) TaxID=123214 RepID=C0QP84_PERMH|nr:MULTISPECIES: Ni/Fe hydrogenase subunit delta [Persephonella]ACO03567.1 putative [NiFe] hydrogenase, delta subunit [Persephonella marina EX-H1]HCB69905.1 Ni/Fe hydrogenase subunit delta [Persephonella sp.]
MIEVGIFKFASCDGCQISFFDISEMLSHLEEKVRIKYFIEGQDRNEFERFDISFIEGSVSTPEQEEKVKKIRDVSEYVVTIGACSSSGGIQSVRNFSDYKDIVCSVYPKPEMIKSLERSRPVSDYIDVDFEIRGCPINKEALLEVIYSVILGKKPYNPEYPVCMECKRKGNPCVIIFGKPCLGSITSAGCGAVCPSYNRGCYGCFGPVKNPQIETLKEVFQFLSLDQKEFYESILMGFNAYHPYIREKI